MSASPEAPPRIHLPLVWALVAGVHVIGAGYAWHMLPHGFAWSHPRFWTNQVIPIAVIAAGIACLVALWRGRSKIAAAAIALFACLHVGMTAAWLVVFPITGGRPAKLSAVIALVVCAGAVASLRLARGLRRQVAAGAVAGLVIGIALVRAQRGPDARTHPAAPARALAEPSSTVEPPALPPWLGIVRDTGVVAIDLDPVHLRLAPLLSFTSRSPDRGWTVFADAADRIGPTRRYAGATVDGATTTHHYAGDEPAVLRLAVPDDTTLQLEAETVLPAAVYSHLNSFCVLEISGHRRLFLEFSAIPSQRIEVRFSQYPVGRPSRFAYVDDASILHVVEAESGEKGPFTELARGPLDAPLAITLFDEQRAIARIELADFAAQASTQPSPTGGWGVPENAIEFSLVADQPGATAFVFMTLAGTSVGRGWDSVGHAPGLYRNRVTVHHGSAPTGIK